MLASYGFQPPLERTTRKLKTEDATRRACVQIYLDVCQYPLDSSNYHSNRLQLSVGFSSIWSMTKTGSGRWCFSSFSPSCLSTASKSETPPMGSDNTPAAGAGPPPLVPLRPPPPPARFGSTPLKVSVKSHAP